MSAVYWAVEGVLGQQFEKNRSKITTSAEIRFEARTRVWIDPAARISRVFLGSLNTSQEKMSSHFHLGTPAQWIGIKLRASNEPGGSEP